MPTLYKPIVSDSGGVWSSPEARAISDAVQESSAKILAALNFYEEHGRLGDADGKFDDQITKAANEVLAEVAGILTFAAAQAAEPKVGTAVATLEWIRKHPSSAQDRTLPGFAEWLLADHYQRDGEEKGAHFQDIMGFRPGGFFGEMKVPDEAAIVNAATAAIEDLETTRSTGRPASAAIPIVADGLRPIFLRYNEKITRHSELTSNDSRLLQTEGGPFFEFIRAAVLPLQTFLTDQDLSNIAASSIVRRAATQIPP